MLIEDFELHETLNPKLWTSDNELRPEVRDKLIEIVDEFKSYVDVPLDVVDVHLVGSNASFNYTDESDLDVHVVTNFELMDASREILLALYNLQKSSFNQNYDISIHGVPVELYVEDIQANTVSNGIYSLYREEWIKFPEKIPVQNYDIEEQLNKYKVFIDQELIHGDYNGVLSVIDDLYLMRKNSMAVDGEYGAGNQLFKEIRSLGLLDALKDRAKELNGKRLSLEGFTRGQIINMDWE